MSSNKLRNKKGSFKKRRKLWIAIAVIIMMVVVWQLPPRVGVAIQLSGLPNRVQEHLNATSTDNAVFQRLGGSSVVSSPIGSTKASVCYLGSVNGGGWVVGGFRQICYWRVTSGYYTDYSIDQVRGLMKNDVALKDMLGNEINPISSCILTDIRDSTEVRYVKAGYKAPRDITQYRFLDYDDCSRPSAVVGNGSLMAGDYSSISYNIVEDVKTVDTTRNQIWVDYDVNAYEEVLGCLPEVGILSRCGRPTDRAIQ